MNGQTAVDTLLFRLGRATGASASFRAQVLTELQLAQRRLEEDPVRFWFLLADRSTIVLTQGEERVPLPQNFVAENEEDVLRVKVTSETDSTYTELLKGFWEEAPTTTRPSATGRPLYYTLWESFIILSPAPDRADYQLQMSYWKRDEAVTLTTENLWLKYAADLLLAETGITLAMTIQNTAALQLFTSQRTQMRMALHHQTVARMEANRNPNPED